MKTLKTLQNNIKYIFADEGLLTLALTHTSYANERKLHANNERLEFLGDAVLEIIISEWLYLNRPNMSEGDMTRTRAGLVCEGSFAQAARLIELEKYILLGKGEETTYGRDKPSLLADAFEALIGAVYLDGGMEAAKTAVINFINPETNIGAKYEAQMSPKSQLQEYLQKNALGAARYVVTSEEGPPHNRTFSVCAYLGERVLGKGVGRTKKEAEQKAAAKAILNFR